MEDYVFVSQLCEDQALCIKVQALWQGTAEGQLRDRMKCAQVAQGIPPRKKLNMVLGQHCMVISYQLILP